MKRSNLYEAIFKRKSIRKYDLISMDRDELEEISEYLSTLKPLFENIKTEFKILPLNDTKSILPWKAPYYIAAFSEIREGYLENIGFMLQQMDLFLSSNGIGSCWQGWTKPAKEVFRGSALEFVIVMAFGKPNESLHRSSVSEFKRKPLEQIRNIAGKDELLEPVRLAPTTNQPWFFTGGDNVIHAHCAKSNFVKALINEKINKIEMGIGICHLWIAAQHFGKDIEFSKNTDAQEHLPGYNYFISLKIA